MEEGAEWEVGVEVALPLRGREGGVPLGGGKW